MLYLYNSLSQKKEKFVPLEAKKVKMYVCGITPYDTTHLGHAFTYVWFDVLFRYLKFKGYQVNYTQNVTDIDDDILKRAKEKKENWLELGDFWIKKFLLDLKSLNVLSPTHFVRATDSITIMIRIIIALIQKGYAYEKNGNVYFEVKKFKEYGRLSQFNAKQMILISKERGGNPDDPLKKNPLDFLLWQRVEVPRLSSKRAPSQSLANTKLSPSAPYWDSPWGKGRPGWHIECSAMINKYLGNQIDIHGGGRDLIFPHHESEIAQSQCFTGKKPFSKIFMHTAMVMYQGEKMSKSLGNLIMVSDLLKKYSSNAIRFVLLLHYYRLPWEFDEGKLKSSEKLFKKISKSSFNASLNKKHINQKILKSFEERMDDDLNVPKVLQSFPKLLNSDDTYTLFYIMKIIGFKT